MAIMIKRTIKVINELGLHARPSSLIVKTAITFKSTITLSKGAIVANCSSILSVMTLAAIVGTVLTLIVEGEDEVEAADAIEALFFTFDKF